MFDQSLIFLGLIQNLGLIAISFVIFILVWESQRKLPQFVWQIILGLTFGIFACLAMSQAIMFSNGLLFDLRGAFLSIPGLFAGPFAAVAAALPAIIARIYFGGEGMSAGILGIILVSAVSVAYGFHLKSRRVHLNFPRLLIYSALLTLISMSALAVIPDRDRAITVMLKLGPAIFISGMVGTLLMGILALYYTHQRRSFELLKSSEKRAEEAMRAKSEFLATISHEIRTPLFGIIGYSELMEQGELSKEQKRNLRNIRQSSMLLSHLIQDLLDFEKLEASQLPKNEEAFDLHDTIVTVFGSLQFEAETKNVAMRLNIGQDMPRYVIGSSRYVSQILYNVVGNAVKFTRDGGSVILSAEQTASENQNGKTAIHITFTCTDTGIGIEKDNLDKIFDTFTQENESISRQYGGTGLGLAIVKKLVASLGGSINVDSQKGQGTTFTIELPFVVVAEIDAHKSDMVIENLYPENGQYDSKAILIAEDIPMNQELISSMLESRGYKVYIAENGEIALDILRNVPISLILMDVRMPVMNGLETTTAIRNDKHLKDIPIIALTANVLPKEIKQCFEVGMDDYLPKPLQSKELYNKLDMYLNEMSEEEFLLGAALPRQENSKLIDTEMLQQYIDFLGLDKIKKTYKDFQRDVLKKQAAIERAEYDTQNMHENIHALASMAGNIGLSGFSRECRDLMDDLDTLDTDEKRKKRFADLMDAYSANCAAFEQQIF
ncbi:MAG: ATP-binding protein [Pseudobdellovibrionaceae bacterium]